MSFLIAHYSSPPAGAVSEDVFLHCHLLPPIRPLCRRQLDLFPCQPRGRLLPTLVPPHLTLVIKWQRCKKRLAWLAR